MKQQKNQVADELDGARRELEASKDECAGVENDLREARTEVLVCFALCKRTADVKETLFHAHLEWVHEFDGARKRAIGGKGYVFSLPSTLFDWVEQVKRLSEFESLYAHEREEKLLMESRMNQRASDLQEALRQVSISLSRSFKLALCPHLCALFCPFFLSFHSPILHT